LPIFSAYAYFGIFQSGAIKVEALSRLLLNLLANVRLALVLAQAVFVEGLALAVATSSTRLNCSAGSNSSTSPYFSIRSSSSVYLGFALDEVHILALAVALAVALALVLALILALALILVLGISVGEI
jgi:hypothetical protein